MHKTVSSVIRKSGTTKRAIGLSSRLIARWNENIDSVRIFVKKTRTKTFWRILFR